MAARTITNEQKKALWGSAKVHGLEKEDLYGQIKTITGKEHMTELTFVEAAKVLDSINRKEKAKRTDEGGNLETQAQRRKIYTLTSILGWSNIDGFIKKYYKVEKLEWLSKQQCNKLIETLKKIIVDKGKGDLLIE